MTGGLAAFGGALTVYFSTLNTHAPLLAPLLAPLGFWLLVHAGLHWRLESWTLINAHSGEKVTHTRDADCRPGERREFERALGKRIREASEGRG